MKQSKSTYETKKEEFFKILNDSSLNDEEKIKKLKLMELTQNLELHQTELQAQNRELQEKEEELLNSKEELDDIFQYAPVASLKLDEKYKILRYNKAAATLLTQNKNSLTTAKPLSLFIHKEDIKNYIELIGKLYDTSRVTGVIRFLNGNKTTYGRVDIQKLIRKKLYYLVVIEDITNEIKNEAILLKSSKNIAMGEMLSMIAHQWKEPLAVITMSNSNLKFQSELNETINLKELQNTTEIISSQIEYMNNTIDDFKSFYEEERLKKELNVKDCVDKAIIFTKAILKFHHIKIDVEYFDSENFTIFSHPDDLYQILITLITNAKDQFVKINKEDKIIKLKVYHDNTNLIFALKNNAGVIPENIIDDIFEKNFSTKNNKDGNGLGLYISQKIANEHLGSKLWVENIPKEDSVVFYLKIPLDNQLKG